MLSLSCYTSSFVSYAVHMEKVVARKCWVLSLVPKIWPRLSENKTFITKDENVGIAKLTLQKFDRKKLL